MRSMVAVGMALCLLSLCAAAYSDAEVSAKSFLFSYNTDFSALRTITSNHVTTPELDLLSNSQITTTVNVENRGNANIEQSSFFSGGRDANDNYKGAGSLFSSATGTGLSKINEELFFRGFCSVINSENNPQAQYKVESKSFGVSMASPGTNDYIFGILSSSDTLTDVNIQRVPRWMIEDPKIFTLSLEGDPLETEEPLDCVDQEVDLNFELFQNELVNYNYDFSRTITNDEITFTKEMKFAKIMG